MKSCIDTCAYSMLMRGDTTIQYWLEQSDAIFVPTIVLGELYTGFITGNQYEKNIKQLAEFTALPGIYIQDITNSIARRYAILVRELRLAGTPIPTNDIWIAATAQDAGAALISRDKHFNLIPGLLVNW